MIAAAGLYASVALLLSLGAITFSMALRSVPASAARAPERWLGLGWAVLALAILSPVGWRVAGGTVRSGAPVEVWSGPRVESAAGVSVSVRWPAFSSGTDDPALIPIRPALAAGLTLGAAGILIALATMLVGRRRLGRLCDSLPVLKRIGNVRVCASDDAPAPFAAHVRGVAFIVVPTGLLAESRRLRLLMAHEAHHHRRGDLQGAAFFGLVRAFFFWNPAIGWWERAMAELQEFACDRHVLRRPQVSASEYGRALLWAAERLQGRCYVIRGALGIADGSRGMLERRIMMLSQARVEPRGVVGGLAATAVTLVMIGSAWAAQGVLADHRVNRADVENWATRIENRAGFPMPVDDGVVARLNGWVADPVARQSMKRAMERMPGYRNMIETTLREQALPTELLGMVMAESAFDNDAHPDRPVEQRSAGLWQILPRTGRQLGLEVSAAVDERLVPQKATEAAAAFLTGLYSRYGDWPVAIAAYNAGQQRIDAIAAGASSPADIRARVLASDGEHARYLRAVIAAIILIDNPSLLD